MIIAIGIPCFTLPKESINNIQKYNNEKNLFLEIDLQSCIAKSKLKNLELNIKESSKKMFLSGEWDATSTLLANETSIEEKFSELPYINFNSQQL